MEPVVVEIVLQVEEALVGLDLLVVVQQVVDGLHAALDLEENAACLINLNYR